MLADLNKIRSEALANDFENQNLKREISDLKKSNLSLSNASFTSTKAIKNESTIIEQHHHIAMLTIPMPEKKKEVMFNLGDQGNRLGSSQTQIQTQTMKQKLSIFP